MADNFGQSMDDYLAKKGQASTPDLNDTFGSSMDMYIQRKNQSFLGQVNQAVDVNPDKFNEQRKIAKQLDTVPAAVEALPVDSQRASKVQTLQANTADAPVLRQQYTNADFAKLAHDDSFSLRGLEKVVQDTTKYFMGVGPGEGIIGTVKAAPFVAAEALSGVKRAAFDVIEPWARLIVGRDNVFGNLSKFNAEQANAFNASAKEITQTDNSLLMGGLQSGGQSFIQSSKYLPLALYGGPAGATAALVGMSMETFGQSYNKAADKNIPLFTRLGYAASDAVIEYGTEKGPLGALVQNLKVGTPLFTSILSNAWKENKGEQVATALQDLNEWAVLNPDKPFSTYLDARPQAAAQTAIAVLFGATGNVALGSALEQIANHQLRNSDTLMQQNMFAQFQPLIDASKLKARDPETFAQFLQAATDGTPAQDLFISAQTLQHSGVVDQLAAVLPTVAEQLPDALASDGFIRIPTADYAAVLAGTPMAQSIIDHIKTDPNGYTFAESKEYEGSFNQEIQTQLEQKLSESSVNDAFKASRDEVRDKFFNELTNAGRFTPTANAAYASLLANFYSVTAAKLGLTPQEFVDKYQLKVIAEDFTEQSNSQSLDVFNATSDATTTSFKSKPAKSKSKTAITKPLDILTQPARGQIFFAKNMTQTPSVMALLEKADLSTFIHESGHFFLQVQADLAMRIQTRISAGESVAPGEQSIVDDMNHLLEWFGIKADTDVSALDRWAQMTIDEQRPFHEKFARGFEAYTLEGNAPTMELQSVFQKFRSWLLSIYRDFKALNVELTDEVRDVLDRMLATSEQIDAAQTARNMGPLFTPQNGSEFIDDWQSYHALANDATASAIDQLQARGMRDMQWLSNARSRFLRDLQKEHDELRTEIRFEVAREVMPQKVYQLWQFLTARTGEEAVRGMTEFNPDSITSFRGKLKTQMLRDMYGEAPNALWRGLSKLHMTSDETGLSPDVIAEIAGYTSADEMVQALLEATPPDVLIDQITDQRMLERHGELVDQDSRDKAADAAVHNDLRARMLQAEARALERAMSVKESTGTTNKKGNALSYAVLPKAAQDFAKRLIAKLKVRDIRPSQYAGAQSQAARAAQQAFAKGDIEGAAKAKRNEIINNYTTRQAYAALTEVQLAVNYLRRFDKPSKTIDFDYYDQIAQILERFDLVPSTSLKAIDRRTSLANWLKSQQEQGYKPDISPELEAESYRKSYKDMTIEELRGLRDTIAQIEHLGRLKQKLLTAHDQRQFDQIRDEMVYSIHKYAKGRSAENRTPNTVLGEKLIALKNFWASHIKAATWARIMDGGVDGGPIWEYLIRTANDAGNREVGMREKATRELSALIAPVLEKGKLGGSGRLFKSVNRTLNREAILAIALNIGNESNTQRLLGGEGWALSQLKPVLDTLTTDEWNFVQGVWDYFETYRPDIGAKEKRLYGKEPKWIEPRALNIQTADGDNITLRGGYYPVKYDPRASERAEAHSEAEDAKRMLQGAYTSATTRRSFTKARVEEVNGRPLLYSLDGIYNGINEIIHDLSWHEWLIDANRILKNPKISESIRDTYGAEVHQQFKTWIKDVAEGERGAQNANQKAAAWLRQSVSVAGLGLNVMSALLQPFGITQSIVRIGGKWVGRGIAKYASDPLGLSDEISQMSEFMRTRSLTQMRELAELRNQVKGQSETRRNIDASMYVLMLKAQQMVDLPTWWGAYEKAIASGNDEARAVALSDQAVIDAQGSGTTKDLAAIERGSTAEKLFTVFYSFMNTSLNLGVAQTMTHSSKMKLAADYLMIYVVPVVLITLMKSALTPGDSGDWDDPKKIAAKLIKEELSYLMGMFIYVREVTPVIDAFRGIAGSGEYHGPAGLRPITDAVSLGKQIGQGQMDDGLRKALVNIAGDLFRLPSAQVNRTITGIEALKEGKTKNPAAVVFGYEERH